MKVFSNDLVFEVTWKPFFLNPTTPESGIPLIQYLTQKYGPRAGAMAKDGTSPLTKAGLNVVIKPPSLFCWVGRHIKLTSCKNIKGTFCDQFQNLKISILNLLNLVLDSCTRSYFQHVCQPQIISILPQQLWMKCFSFTENVLPAISPKFFWVKDVRSSGFSIIFVTLPHMNISEDFQEFWASHSKHSLVQVLRRGSLEAYCIRNWKTVQKIAQKYY